MSIDPKLLVSNFPVIMGLLGLLIAGKTILLAAVGRLFGVPIISAIRVGLLLAPGGEFAFVAFGEAVNQFARVKNALAYATHKFFQENGFVWISSPIITASDCEGAGEQFCVTTLIDPAERLDPEVEDILVDIADEFVESVNSISPTF